MEKNRGLEWVREKGLEIMEITIIILIMFPKFKACASLLGLGLFWFLFPDVPCPGGTGLPVKCRGLPCPGADNS